MFARTVPMLGAGQHVLVNRLRDEQQQRSSARSFDLLGNPWELQPPYDFEVYATSACKDDEEAASAFKPFRLLLAKSDDQHVQCTELMPFGQDAVIPFAQEVAEFCPISACLYNALSIACRVSCACPAELNLRHPRTGWGPLCVAGGVAELLLNGTPGWPAPKEVRCESSSCHATDSINASHLRMISRYDTYIDDLCPPPFQCYPQHGMLTWKMYWQIFSYNMNDGIYALAMA